MDGLDTNQVKKRKRKKKIFIYFFFKYMYMMVIRTTYASEYFQELYELAVELIKVGKAFVCHQTSEEIRACREIARAKVIFDF